MKKLERKNLDELAQFMPIISENEQKWFIGGGMGTCDCPYTYEEFERMLNSGTWEGGYVEGQGYIMDDVIITERKLFPFDGNGTYFDGFGPYLQHMYGQNDLRSYLLDVIGFFPVTDHMLDNWRKEWTAIAIRALDAGYGDCEKIYVETNGMNIKVYDAYTGELISTGNVSLL